MDAGSVFLVVLAGLFLIGVTIAGAAGFVAYRILRAIVRRVRPVRRIQRGTLRYQTLSGPAGRRQLHLLRWQLRNSIEATQRSLAVAGQCSQRVGDLPYITQTLTFAAGALDRQLSVAAKDPDPAVQGMYANNLSAHVNQVVQTASGVRQALARTAQPMTDLDLTELTRRLALEARLLDNWSATYSRLGHPRREEFLA